MPHLSFVNRSNLESPQQEVQSFLKDQGTPESKQLQVSLLFTESMLLELREVVLQWQAMLATLQQAEADLDSEQLIVVKTASPAESWLTMAKY